MIKDQIINLKLDFFFKDLSLKKICIWPTNKRKYNQNHKLFGKCVRNPWEADLYLLEWVKGEGNGNPLQYSCLENPMDRGAWWVAIHGVAKSRTRLKRLSSIHIYPLPSEPPSHLLPHTTPLHWYRALVEFPEPYSKFPLAIYFTYGNVSFHVLFPYISPSPPLSPCPQVYSLCLFLHCCPVNKFFSTIFLDSVF